MRRCKTSHEMVSGETRLACNRLAVAVATIAVLVLPAEARVGALAVLEQVRPRLLAAAASDAQNALNSVFS